MPDGRSVALGTGRGWLFKSGLQNLVHNGFIRSNDEAAMGPHAYHDSGEISPQRGKQETNTHLEPMQLYILIGLR